MPDDTPPVDAACDRLDSAQGLAPAVGPQTDMVYVAALGCQEAAPGVDDRVVQTNEEAWELFRGEELRSTHRLTLDHFHLFEWFPLCPGRAHLPWAAEYRRKAREHQMELHGDICYTRTGKGLMLQGGVGAVRLAPRPYGGTEYHLMTASATGVCHAGFPVAVPDRLYEQVRDRIIAQGATPVRVSGEMRYVPKDKVPLFHRDVPLLMLHVTELAVLNRRRPNIDGFAVTPVVTFTARDDPAHVQSRAFVSFYTFDPAQRNGLAEATDWLERVYVHGAFGGQLITHFDEAFPHKFPEAVFGLPRILNGQLDERYLRQALQQIEMGWVDTTAFVASYQTVVNIGSNTGTVIGTVVGGQGAADGTP